MNKIKSKEELAQEIRWLRAKQERDLRRIDELEEQVKGYQELIGINNALIATVLNTVGEICIPRYAVVKALDELDVAVMLDTERDAYYMNAVKRGEL